MSAASTSGKDPALPPRSHSAADWAAGRGEKWAASADGLEAMLQPIDAPLLQALRLEGPGRIADIGCGGGATSRALLRHAPAGSSVTGVDISPALIALAKSRAPADARGLDFALADVATSAPPGGPFDRLVSRFGLMFFDDPPAAFANLARWLRPGGRFAFAVWGPPAANPWVTTVRDAVAAVVPLPAPEPDAPGLFRYGTVEPLVAMLARAGFGAVAVEPWRGTLQFGGGMSAAAAARFAIASFAGFAELLAAGGSAAQERALASLTETLGRHERNGVVQLAACAHIVTGTGAGG